MTFYVQYPQTTAVTDMRAVPAIVRSIENDRFNDSISYQPDNRWRAFVDTLSSDSNGFDKVHTEAVKAVWDSIKQAFTVTVPLPLTQPTSEGNIQLAWDAGRYYVELEVRRNGQLEWFFRDRDTNELDGTEEIAEDSLSSSFLTRFATIVA